MRDKYDEAIDEVVYIVARLWFGETAAMYTANQQLVRAALEQHGLNRVIHGLDDRTPPG